MLKILLPVLFIFLLTCGLIAFTLKINYPGFSTLPGRSIASEDPLKNINAIIALDHTMGSSTKLTSLILTSDGYAVIYDQVNGQPGSVIGHSQLFTPGHYNQVPINLSRPTIQGEVLYAVIHKDDGDGVFEFPGDDAPLTDQSGNIIKTQYTVGQINEG